MALEDLNNNRNVRRVLVRHWVDLGRVAIRSAGGRVTISGKIQLLRGVKHSMDAQLMETIYLELNRIKEVKRLTIELDNWVYVEGVWQESERPKRDSSSFDGPSTYEM